MAVISLLATLLSVGLIGQTLGQTTLSSGVEVRTVTIWVHGKSGRPPKPLRQTDFTVFENRVQQPITLFFKNTDDPKVTRYELGYTVRAPDTAGTKHIEVRVRGFRKSVTRDLEKR